MTLQSRWRARLEISIFLILQTLHKFPERRRNQVRTDRELWIAQSRANYV